MVAWLQPSPTRRSRRAARQHDARVVRRAAAHDPRAQLGAVLALGLPRVREGQPAGVEDVRRPAPAVVGPVVGAGLEQADLATALAQPRREHAPGRAAADDQELELGAPGHPRTISENGLMSTDPSTSRGWRAYAQQYGWDETFEALVARIVADYAESHDPRREAAWIAEVDGEPAGCVLK